MRFFFSNVDSAKKKGPLFRNRVLNTRPTATRKKKKGFTIQHSCPKKKRDGCSPFPNPHKLTTAVTNIPLQAFLDSCHSYTIVPVILYQNTNVIRVYTHDRSHSVRLRLVTKRPSAIARDSTKGHKTDSTKNEEYRRGKSLRLYYGRVRVSTFDGHPPPKKKGDSCRVASSVRGHGSAHRSAHNLKTVAKCPSARVNYC